MTTKVVEIGSSTKFIWKIENFSLLNAHQGTCSDIFTVAGFQWKAHIHPKGAGKVYDHLSLFLVPVGSNISRYAEFSFTITSQTDSKNRVKLECKHKFTVDHVNGMGWSKLMRLDEFHDPSKGYMVDDTCVITIEILCRLNE